MDPSWSIELIPVLCRGFGGAVVVWNWGNTWDMNAPTMVLLIGKMMINQCWLVVSNMNFIFHFIYGMSSFPLTNSIIFQDGYLTTTNQNGYDLIESYDTWGYRHVNLPELSLFTTHPVCAQACRHCCYRWWSTLAGSSTDGLVTTLTIHSQQLDVISWQKAKRSCNPLYLYYIV